MVGVAGRLPELLGLALGLSDGDVGVIQLTEAGRLALALLLPPDPPLPIQFFAVAREGEGLFWLDKPPIVVVLTVDWCPHLPVVLHPDVAE